MACENAAHHPTIERAGPAVKARTVILDGWLGWATSPPPSTRARAEVPVGVTWVAFLVVRSGPRAGDRIELVDDVYLAAR